jgi:uncharacterized membrane protein (UPF0127 family)
VDGRDVAPIDVAVSRRSRARGLLGRTGIDGALLLIPVSSVHTFGMRFPIDVALCTADLEVLAVRTMGPRQVTVPRLRVRAVLEAEAGSFERWGLTASSILGVSAWRAPPRC